MEPELNRAEDDGIGLTETIIAMHSVCAPRNTSSFLASSVVRAS